jgi:5'(3')-deoxyribonucleotidase
MKALNLGFDMDGILVNLLGQWLKDLAVKFPPLNVTMDDVVTFKLHHCPKLSHLSGNQILGLLHEPGYFANLPAIDGAIEALGRIAAKGHNIHIVTALPGNDERAERARANKLEWLAKNLTFQLPANRIHFAEAERKAEHKFDVFVDDRAETLISYKATHPDAVVLGITYPYNMNVLSHEGITLAHGYKNTRHAWEVIESIIDSVASGNWSR